MKLPVPFSDDRFATFDTETGDFVIYYKGTEEHRIEDLPRWFYDLEISDFDLEDEQCTGPARMCRVIISIDTTYLPQHRGLSDFEAPMRVEDIPRFVYALEDAFAAYREGR